MLDSVFNILFTYLLIVCESVAPLRMRRKTPMDHLARGAKRRSPIFTRRPRRTRQRRRQRGWICHRRRRLGLYGARGTPPSDCRACPTCRRQLARSLTASRTSATSILISERRRIETSIISRYEASSTSLPVVLCAIFGVPFRKLQRP